MASAMQRPNHPPAGNGAAHRRGMRSRQSSARPVWQLILIGAAALFLGLGLLGFLWIFARPLALAILGITIAAALAPLVRWVANLMPRVVAIALVYLLVFLLVGGLVWLLLPSFSSDMQGFTQRLPQLFDQAQQWFNRQAPVDLSTVVDSLRSSLNNTISQIIQVPVQFASALLDTLLVIFLSLYALVAAPKFRDFVGGLAPEARRARVEQVMAHMAEAMGGYVRGVFISGLIIGVLTYIGLWIIGVEFRLALAVISGVLEIVPVFGSIIAGALIVAVALFQSVSTALIALIFVIVLQQIEGNIVSPLVLGHETETSPFLTLLAFFAGAAAGGLVGALVAVPLAAALRVFVLRVVAPAIRRWFGVTDGEIRPVDTN